jgi:hypothetical protein
MKKCRQACDLTQIRVKIPADLSPTGRIKWKKAKIDACVAPLVDALQRGGIDMRGSCCGHGYSVGEIQLQDGRLLLILDEQAARLWMSHADEMQRRLEQMIRDRALESLDESLSVD